MRCAWDKSKIELLALQIIKNAILCHAIAPFAMGKRVAFKRILANIAHILPLLWSAACWLQCNCYSLLGKFLAKWTNERAKEAEKRAERNRRRDLALNIKNKYVHVHVWLFASSLGNNPFKACLSLMFEHPGCCFFCRIETFVLLPA